MNSYFRLRLVVGALAGLCSLPWTLAHCDTLSGPVIADARAALSTGSVTPILKWLRPEDEAQVSTLFAQILEARRHSSASLELLDRYFFETVVRLHRAGEGESFTGLKSEDATAPGIDAADAAIARGDISDLSAVLQPLIAAELETRLQRVLAAKSHQNESVSAGRAFVAEYVGFVHFTERLFALLGSDDAHHRPPEIPRVKHETHGSATKQEPGSPPRSKS